MWYEGYDGINWRIGYATSNDGYKWIKHQNFVLDNLDSIDDKNAHDPRVLLIDGAYKMWHVSSSQYLNNFHINFTTSLNGINWFEPQVNILGPSNIWEMEKGISYPYVLFNNNQYKMWYGAYGPIDGASSWRIGYATSSDGIGWNKYSNPILTANKLWEGPSVASPQIIVENNIYHMFYHASGGIGHAVSSDGIYWQKDPDNPILTPGPADFDSRRLLNPFVIKGDGIYYLYYTGEGWDYKWQIGLATSSDPLPTLLPTNIPSLTQTPTPTLTPTPTRTPTPSLSPTPSIIVIPTLTLTPTSSINTFSPIIILPGIGASWNPRDIFSCDPSRSGNWKVAPFVSLYNRLTKTLTDNAHLKLNQDVYLYGYDWRLPLDQQGEKFKQYLSGILTKKPHGTKVRLVGHSLGGLVIRNYLTNNLSSHSTEQVITIGTPHQGSILVYPLWEKGELWSDDLLMKMAVNALINQCRIPMNLRNAKRNLSEIRWLSDREVIHRFSPSVKDLLPTFDFLRQNGNLKGSNALIYKNDWIINHPFPENLYSIPFETISGSDIPTFRYLDIADPSLEEKNAGDWKDGKPINSEKISAGDGTVLHLSSQINGADNLVISGDHREIINSTIGIEKILQFLGLIHIQVAKAEVVPEITSINMISVMIDAEAKMSLTTPQGIAQASDDQVITVFDPETGNYRLKITPSKTILANLYLSQYKNKSDIKNASFQLQLDKDKTREFILRYIPYHPTPFLLLPKN